ncbi:MAG: hypothetical protein ACI4SC_05170 [Candidatus Neoclostridium sp.]
MMRYIRQIENNYAVAKTLEKIRNGGVSHAYSIVSEDEYSAKVAAMLIISAISGADTERLERGGYADVKTYPSERDKVLTADIDDLTDTAFVTPTELNYKFYIIEKASTMNESAQNKLLKTLEEAPSKVVIILLVTTAFAILPTVSSRCNRVEIAPAPDEEMRRALLEYYGETNLDLAVSLSDGYFGTAEKVLSDEEYAKDLELAVETLLCMKTSKNILSYSKKWCDRAKTLPDVIDCTSLLLQDCASASLGLTERVRLKSRLKDVKSLCGEYTDECAALIQPHLWEAKKKLSQYCSAQTVVDQLLFKILEVKAKCRKS